jgi:hypothetical protein
VTAENIIKTKIKLELPCPLSERELLDRARQKSAAELELEQLEQAFADVKKQWATRLEIVEKKIGGLGRVIRDEAEQRVIECYERYVSDGAHAGQVETVRTDTSTVVERRAANLLESRGANVPESPEQADAARTQRDAGVEEDDEGDVVAPAGDGKRKPKSRKR